MRIALILYGDPHRMTGGFLYDRMLTEYLRRQGDTVEIISLPWLRYGRALFPRAESLVESRLADFSPEMLLVDELCHPSLFRSCEKIKCSLHCPMIAIVHHLRSCEDHPAGLKRLYEIVENKFLSSMDGFIFNSANTQKTVTARIGNKRPGVVTYPGGDRFGMDLTDDELIARAVKPGPLNILFIGALMPRKGLHHLISALTGLKAGTWHLTVVGNLNTDRHYAKAIRTQIAAAGLNGSVSLEGEIVDDKLIDQLKSSHVLAVPSFFEGFGIVYLEGMGFGLPAVAAEAGGAEAIVAHGVNGYLIPYGDTLLLGAYLGKLAADREHLTEMGLAALRTYRHHPTWEDTGEKNISFLHQFS
ncbi:MAG: glycosyltransferase family 4 protein [Deltaproteobacteria bacterium]|nr:glycosyltransferase family 4 protein [Deltaproteobacteria bacterium]